MKVFIGAIAVLLLEIAVIIFACIYTSSFTNELISRADRMPTTKEDISSHTIEAAKEMEQFATEKGRFLFLFVNHVEWETVMSKISEIRTRLETDSFEDYYSKLAELKYELKEFKSSEEFSIKSIL